VGLQFAGKRLASNRQPIHLGSAKPTEISELAGFGNWGQKLKARKILGSKFVKAPDTGCI
jgi:hypothetical protein